jgi:hypothetical protein
MKCLSFYIMLFWVGIGYGQDTSFVKSAYGGSSITVPAGVTWQIDRVFINNGTGYNIQISNANFKSSYTSGEKISVPLYISEMELLNKKEGVFYIFYINQQKE